MTVWFIGAGPGDPDLLTIRGRDVIARCPVCLYAGSLVPEAVVAHAPDDALVLDTAPMTLDDIIGHIEQAHAAGHDVARVHSGDPSLYGAIGEQIRWLEALGIDFEIESYLEHHANQFIGKFDANCYLYLSRAMDLFDASDHGGTVDAALARTDLESALVIAVRTDFLFPPQQQEELALGLEAAGVGVTHRLLHSIQGHDSFLIDMDRFRPVVAEFF